MTRTYKYQVVSLMNAVSQMEGCDLQFHDLRKEHTPSGMTWKVNYYNSRGDWNSRFVGNTLAEANEHFLAERDDAQWRGEMQAKQ